ncbi:MAG: alpha-1,2-fucosyltransferase [Saprospiraceae bacterium]
MKLNKIVYADLQRVGMCNRLFTWATAIVFSYKYNLPVRIHGWYKTQIGPWIRNEKNKRIYYNYFNKHSGILQFKIRERLLSKGVLFNPPLNESVNINPFHTIVFNSIPHSDIYFNDLKDFRPFIIKELNAMIRTSIRMRIESAPKPGIGVHVRKGDFMKTGQSESNNYFITTINYVRSKYDNRSDVYLFTDSRKEEIQNLLDLPNVRIYQGETDIEDLMVLSKSRIIVTSHHSSFSYWAGFLSDALIIHTNKYQGHPNRNKEFKVEAEYLIEVPQDSF